MGNSSSQLTDTQALLLTLGVFLFVCGGLGVGVALASAQSKKKPKSQMMMMGANPYYGNYQRPNLPRQNMGMTPQRNMQMSSFSPMNSQML